jgi:hypothetical protein
MEWLLDSDPAIRWQVMRDLAGAPPAEVSAERARIAGEGWGARLLSLQRDDGQWEGGVPSFRSPQAEAWWRALPPGQRGTLFPEWTSTCWSLVLLKDFGLDPRSPEARRAVDLVRQNVRWEHGGEPFFDGEVEPCINGRTVALGAYFGVDVEPVVERLLGEQMEDGGWNCEQENGSTRGSFHTTLDVLTGLLEFERATGGSPAVVAARRRGEEYLVSRGLLRRASTGGVVDPEFLALHHPTFWHFDVLRGLDHLAAAGADPDPRLSEAIELVRSKRDGTGRWPLENPYPGRLHFELDEGAGRPSRWNTLRALRVLRWWDSARPA